MDLVAHRYGNDPVSATEGANIADLIEIDLHLWRGRLEVRHAKRLWLFQRMWEQWYLLAADTPVPTFHEILDAVPDTTPLLVDLKGWRPRLASKVRSELGDERPVVVSARAWWLLRRFRDRPATRRLRSVGTGWQLWLVLRIPRKPNGPGVVIHQRLLRHGVAARLLARHPILFAWNIESEQRAMELADAGASGLIIDDAALIRVLDSRPGRCPE